MTYSSSKEGGRPRASTVQSTVQMLKASAQLVTLLPHSQHSFAHQTCHQTGSGCRGQQQAHCRQHRVTRGDGCAGRQPQVTCDGLRSLKQTATHLQSTVIHPTQYITRCATAGTPALTCASLCVWCSVQPPWGWQWGRQGLTAQRERETHTHRERGRVVS